MCLYPRLFRNRKYTKTKKNGGNIPPVKDPRTTLVPVGCQKCMECRKQKAREWQVRLLEDIKTNTNGKFVALTFSNENYTKLLKECEKKGAKGYDLDNMIATRSIRLFLERWRKKYKKSLRHWLVTELGHNGTEHLHLHGIVYTDEPLEKVEKHWQYGYMWKGKPDYRWKGKGIVKLRNYVNAATVNYMVKYIHKIDEKHKEYISKVLCSPGIGSNYVNTFNASRNTYNATDTNETYRTNTGHKISLPIYWRNKLYNENQRENLWLQKLDNKERWVNGERVSIKDGEEEYFKLLEYHRIINKRLGYGTDEIDWERKIYENELRTLKQQERQKGKQP